MECGVRLHLISLIAKLRAPSRRDPLPLRNAVAADVSRLILLPRGNNERTDIRCHGRICHHSVPKAPAIPSITFHFLKHADSPGFNHPRFPR